MSGSFGGSKSDSSSNTGFNQDVWNPQGEALQGMYGQAGDLMGQSMGKGGKNAGQAMDFGQRYSQDSMNAMQQPWQQQMQGGAYGGMNLQGQMNESIAGMQNAPNYEQDINAQIMGGAGNDYADAMKGEYMQDAQRAQEQMLGGLDARASASGMSGGSRHGTATAQGMEDINRNLQGNMARTGYETFDKNLDRNLDIARQADTNAMQRAFQNQNTIGQLMGGQQGAMQGGLNFGDQMNQFGQQQQMMPWQQMGAYSNTLGGPTVLSSGQSGSSGSAKGKSGSGGAK